jgi:hypothetical protein
MSKTKWKALLVLLVISALVLIGYLLFRRKNSPQPCLVHASNTTPPTPDPNVMPGGRREDIEMAQTNPDEYAWRLFLALNRQALPGKRGLSDPSYPTIREFEVDKPVIWETWALTSGGRNGKHKLPQKNTSEVFLDRGATPPPWDQLGSNQKSFELYPSKQMHGVTQIVDAALSTNLKSQGKSEKEVQNALERDFAERFIGEPNPGEEAQGIGEEVRMNRPLFEHIVANNLYNIEGLEEAFRKFKESWTGDNFEMLNVPSASQEIKAKWVRIREEDKPRYHWRQIKGSSGETQIWGLTALHIMTKDLHDWFWSDFEHIDYLALPVQSVNPDFGSNIVDRAEVESRDTTTRTTAGCDPKQGAKDCSGKYIEGLRGETVGTKWANYRLRGTQTTFTCYDASSCNEIPTVLANTQLERGFQQTSSCITCHSRASIGEREQPEINFFPNRPEVFLQVGWLRPSGFLLIGAIGNKKSEWYLDPKTAKLRYAQTDYLWSVTERAMSTKAITPETVSYPICSKPCPLPTPSTPSR